MHSTDLTWPSIPCLSLQTTSITFYLDMLVELRRPALLVGLAGSGKTALINGKIRTLPDDYMTMICNFNCASQGPRLLTLRRTMLECF